MKTCKRRIWLIRHAKPDFPTEEHYCVGGGTDWPIGAEGRKQCEALSTVFFPVLKHEKEAGRSVELWSSPMLRARQTAQYLAEAGQEIKIKDGLQEACAGAWDGKPFSWIRENYPEVYQARGKIHDLRLVPGAESNERCLERSKKALQELLEESEADDIVLVIHATVIQLLIAAMKKEPLDQSRKYKPEYAGFIELPIEVLEEFLKSRK